MSRCGRSVQGKTATAEQANEMAAYIRSVVAELYGAETAEQVIISTAEV